jgi:hypothetical protein
LAFVLAVLVSPFILKRDKPLPRKSQVIYRIPNKDLQKPIIAVHPLINSFKNHSN